MTNIQLITSLKNQLSISIVLGMMLLNPVKSIGNIKTQSINTNLQPSGASLTIQETHKQLSVSIPGGVGIDTVKNNPDLDTHFPGGKAA